MLFIIAKGGQKIKLPECVHILRPASTDVQPNKLCILQTLLRYLCYKNMI